VKQLVTALDQRRGETAPVNLDRVVTGATAVDAVAVQDAS